MEPLNLADDEIRMVFNGLDKDNDCFIAEKEFEKWTATHYMKVVSPVVCAEEIDINTTVFRKLPEKDVLEVLEGPVLEGRVYVMRVRVRAMKDDQIVWVTVAGNASIVFLVESGNE